MTVRQGQLLVYGGIAAASLVGWLILWTLWVNIPWWQTIIVLALYSGVYGNLTLMTEILLKKKQPARVRGGDE